MKDKNAVQLMQELAEKAKSKPLQVSRKFVNDFNAVAAHYRCDPEEIKIMKDLVRKNPKEAEESYSIMAEEVRYLDEW